MEKQRALVEIVRADPNVRDVNSFVGAGGSSASVNQARFFAVLKPRAERALNADLAELQAWVPRIKARLKELPGIVDVASDLRIVVPGTP